MGRGRKGNCWDNAVAESFFSSLKKERDRRTDVPWNLIARGIRGGGGARSRINVDVPRIVHYIVIEMNRIYPRVILT
jgi:transposase InsO family protein